MTPGLGAGTMADSVPVAPYLSLTGALLALGAAVLLCWPMLLTSAPLLFTDTIGYWSNGEALWGRLIGMAAFLLPSSAGQVLAETALSSADQSAGGNVAITLRSLPYAAFLYATGVTPLGLVLTCIVQTAITLWMFLGLVPPLAAEERRRAIVGFAAVGTLTTLPWFASYAMPDLLGAVLPAYYALALGRIDGLGLARQVVLGALAAFAILAHYGNLPLACALAVAVLLWRAWKHRSSLVAMAACLLPLFVAAGLNLATSVYMARLEQPAAVARAQEQPAQGAPAIQLATARVAPQDAPHADSGGGLGAATLTPNRIPALLARSIEDGPARWYLNEECRETDRYAVCELFDEMPRNIPDFLWVGLGRATDEQMARIRAEEMEIVVAAARRYPLEQLGATLGNAGLQFVLVGIDDLWLYPPEARGMAINDIRVTGGTAQRNGVQHLFDWITAAATGVAFLLLAWRVITRRTPAFLVPMVLLILFALVVNSAIFGGLSATVDRYQSRMVWLVPALLALDFAIRSAGVRRGRADAPLARRAAG